MVWGCACGLDIIVRSFFVTFSTFMNLSNFLTSMYRQWVPCEHNSSYNIILIFLKLCTCFLHGLKMCMWFGCNHCINFCCFFPLCELCHFLTSDSTKVLRQWIPCERSSSYNFIPIFLKLCTYFPHGLEMCMWFGYNPWFNFVTFSTLLTLSFSDLRFYESVETILYRSFWNFAHIFPIVWRCACGLDIILELILSLFPLCELCHFLTSDSMKV